jgi:predicted dehydrogenase
LSEKLSVLLIGLGGIGCKYDYPKNENDSFSLTDTSKSHLGAILRSGMTLVGGIDSDEKSRKLFEKYSLVQAWDSITNFPKNHNIDLAVISSPTMSHRYIFQEVVDHIMPKAIIIEKPFGANARDSTYMLELASVAQIPVLVNYSRNYSQGFQKIRETIENSKLVSGNVYYSQGLQRNGSHFIRLMLEFFGAPLSVVENHPGVHNFNPSFTFGFADKSFIHFTGSNSSYVRVGEIVLETEKYLIQISEGSQYRISLLNKEANPVEWPTQLEIVDIGNLDGGMQKIYSDLNWMQPEFYGKQIESNFLDNLCNEILDGLLLQ